MKLWEEKTCIRFKERTDEKDYIEFFADFGKYVLYNNISCKIRYHIIVYVDRGGP